MKQFIFIICFFCSCVSYAQSNRGWRAEIGTGITTEGYHKSWIEPYPEQSSNYLGGSYYWQLGGNVFFEAEALTKLRVRTEREIDLKKKYVGENYPGNEFGFIYYTVPGDMYYGIHTCIGGKAGMGIRRSYHTSSINLGIDYDPGWLFDGRTYIVNIGTTHILHLQKAKLNLLLRSEICRFGRDFYTLSLGIGLQWAKKLKTP
jgi:hypothetical protein